MIQGNFNEPRAVVVNRNRDMALYDMLPSAIRRALSEAPVPMSAADVAQAMVDGCPPVEALRFVQAETNATWSAYRRKFGL